MKVVEDENDLRGKHGNRRRSPVLHSPAQRANLWPIQLESRYMRVLRTKIALEIRYKMIPCYGVAD